MIDIRKAVTRFTMCIKLTVASQLYILHVAFCYFRSTQKLSTVRSSFQELLSCHLTKILFKGFCQTQTDRQTDGQAQSPSEKRSCVFQVKFDFFLRKQQRISSPHWELQLQSPYLPSQIIRLNIALNSNRMGEIKHRLTRGEFVPNFVVRYSII